ncbi:glycosyltransferase [Rhizobium sp. PAMB 3182]
MAEEKLRVISIAHTAVSRPAGRLRYHPFAESDDLDVHLVVPRRWRHFGRTILADPGDDPGVTMHVLPILFSHAGPFSWYLHCYWGLAQLIRQVRPHVIHLWEEPWSVVALQACLLKGDAALVMEVDQNILKTLPPPFETMRKYVLAHTSHVLSRSDDATMVVRARGYDGPVSMISYGVDTDIFSPAEPRPEPADAGMVIGYVGRLVEEKGVQDALDAMARSPADIRLEMIGEGPYEQKLKEKAEALGIADRVTIRPWSTPEVVAEFLRKLDALILLTHTTAAVKEQFGRVIIEAQGCGIPVIGAQSGAIPDIVADGGWIVPQRDPDALSSLLSRLASDPAERRRKAQAGIDNVRSRFTYPVVADQLYAAWRAAADTPRR